MSDDEEGEGGLQKGEKGGLFITPIDNFHRNVPFKKTKRKTLRKDTLE